MNTVTLLPGVVDGLVKLNGVLRPLIQREWARRVARMNDFQEEDVLDFLFDSQRVDTSPLRKGLREIQGGVCFFCASPLDGEVHVDHFIPRARYADDSLDNLVLSDAKCNSAKKAMLASLPHVERWTRRFGVAKLEALASEESWPRDAARTRCVSQSLYRGLPSGALLWQGREETISIDAQREDILDRLLKLNV